jgi:hypothetical protein
VPLTHDAAASEDNPSDNARDNHTDPEDIGTQQSANEPSRDYAHFVLAPSEQDEGATQNGGCCSELHHRSGQRGSEVGKRRQQAQHGQGSE